MPGDVEQAIAEYRKEKYRKYQREYQRNRYHNDPEFREKALSRSRKRHRKKVVKNEIS